MISPVNIAISQSRTCRWELAVKREESVVLDPVSGVLSGGIAAQAILARNMINFRAENSTEPVDITSFYNKKSSGGDHLDLSNIKVYEYPDTNLRVFVDADDKNIQAGRFFDAPQISIVLNYVNSKKYNIQKEAVLQLMLENKLKAAGLENNMINTPFVTHGSLKGSLALSELEKMNFILFNSNFSQTDLDAAKEEFINLLEQGSFITSDKISKTFYDETDLIPEQELVAEVYNYSLEEIQEYYKDYLKSCTLEAYVTVSKEYFNKNKRLLFETLNKNVPKSMISRNEKNSLNTFEKKKNNDLKIFVEENPVAVSYNFSIPNLDKRDSILLEFATVLLNEYLEHYGYFVEKMNMNLPLNLKPDTLLKFDGSYISIKTDEEVFNKEVMSVLLREFITDGLSEENLKVLREAAKVRYADIFTGETIGVLKNIELFDAAEDVFMLYEYVDSITVPELVNFVQENLMEPLLEAEV